MSSALDPVQSTALLASAGTGKTWTLTARIVRLLLAGAAPGGILALTFTRKAAAEMRSRVADRLQTLAFADEAALTTELRAIGAPDDDASREKARGLFEAFIDAEVPLRASTLHVFCAEVLRRFALEAEVPAGFALVENERPLRAEAIEQVLQRAHRDPQGALAQALDVLAAEGLSEYEVQSLLYGLFEHRSEIWAATEGEAEPLPALCAALSAALPFSADEAVHGAIESPAVQARLKMLVGMLMEVAPVGTVKGEKLAAAIEQQGSERFETLLTVLFTKEGKPRAFKPPKAYSPAQAATALEHFGLVSAAIEAARQARLRQATYHRSRAALTLGLAALDGFAARLQRHQQLGFAELEWQTVRLLHREGRAEWVRYKLDQQLEHVLLDEFQDTSPTQWQLLRPLLSEFAVPRERPRTVFLVGDPKQSIYGFRRAEPALLGIASQELVQQLGARLESLDESRRSAPAIIRFANALFEGEAGEAIQFTPHRTARTALYGAVEIAPLIQPVVEAAAAANDAGALRNPLEQARETPEDRRAAEEAQWVVDRIVQLVDRRTPVTARDGSTRPLHPGDVMVLARHRTHLGALEKALAAAGVPYTSATRGTLLDTALARDLLALLAALDSPHRDLELAHALRSPLFSVSDEELLQLTRSARTAACSLAMALEQPQSAPRLVRAQALLAAWRRQSHTLPPHDLIDRIASEGDLLRRCRAARPHDSQLGANLAALLQLALDSDHGRYPTLGGFLRDCAELGRHQGPDEAPPPSSEARVRVMTVHAAKGLEAPAVFLVNTAPTPRSARAGWRVDWPAEAERPRVIVHAGSKAEREPLSTALIAAAEQREAREALNLLYVAVTRAQQYLFVSGFQSGPKLQTESWHARCRSALNGLLATPVDAALIAQYREGTPPAVTAAAVARAVEETLDPRLLKPLFAAAPLPRSDAAADPVAALRGEVIHAALQQLAEGHSPSSGLRRRVEQQLGLHLPDALWQAALDEASTVRAASALAPLFDPAHRAWNELPLLIDGPQGPVLNVIDRLVDTGEALWVLDYKTHRARDAATVLEGAREQLLRYAAAVRRLHADRVLRLAVVWTPEARLLELATP